MAELLPEASYTGWLSHSNTGGTALSTQAMNFGMKSRVPGLGWPLPSISVNANLEIKCPQTL